MFAYEKGKNMGMWDGDERESINRSINRSMQIFAWDQSVLCHEPMSATDSILRTYKTVHMFPRYKAIQDLEILRLF